MTPTPKKKPAPVPTHRMKKKEKPVVSSNQSVEVWLTQHRIDVTCRLVASDGRALLHVPVESMSMRGAQREITGYLSDLGLEPKGRWEFESEISQDHSECWRRFKATT